MGFIIGFLSAISDFLASVPKFIAGVASLIGGGLMAAVTALGMLMPKVFARLRNLVLIVLVIALWFAFGDKFNQVILPSLPAVIQALVNLVRSGEMLSGLSASMVRCFSAIGLSIVVSIPLSLLTVNFRWVREIVQPFTNLMRFIPPTVLFPLMIIWVGLGEELKIAFLFLATFFYFFPSTVQLLESTDIELVEIALTGGASKWQLMSKVYLPVSLPAMCKGFLTMFGIAVNMLIVAEGTNAPQGIGHLLLISSSRGRTPAVFACIIVIVVVGVAIDVLGNFLIKRMFKWYRVAL